MAETGQRHPAVFSVISLLLIAPLYIVGLFAGRQLIVTLGIRTNTSPIDGLGGMALGRLPFAVFHHHRSIHLQHLAQSAISAAALGAGNALLLPIGIPFAMGMPVELDHTRFRIPKTLISGNDRKY